MSRVTVRYRGELREITGCAYQEIEAETIRDVLKHIRRTWGRAALAEAERMVIAVNGKSILLLNNDKTVLSGGDTVFFIPICGGG